MNTSTVKKAGILVNRRFMLLWSGQSISAIGDFVFDTTLILWIATRIARGQPWAPLAVSGVLLAASIPVFLVGPVAGVLVDRWNNKRLTMLLMDAARTLLILLLFLVSLVPGDIPLPFTMRGLLPIAWQLGAIYGIVFLASACAQFFNPSSLALLSDIVDESQIARGSGMIQAAFSFAMLFGPPLGTLLFFAAGVQWGLLLNALSFVVSFVCIAAIRVPRMIAVERSKLPANFLREFIEGIRFFGRSRVLMALGITGVLIVLGAGALNALDVFFVTQNLHAQVSLYGLLGSALGCGLIAGSALAALFAQRIGVTRTFWLSVVGWGVVALVYARLTSFFPAVGVLFFLGVMNAVFNATAAPLIISSTPRNFIGRVQAVFNPVFSLVGMFSVSIAGYLDSTVLHSFHARLLGISIGSIDTIFTGTGILAILGGLYAMVSLRGVRLTKESEGSTEPVESRASDK